MSAAAAEVVRGAVGKGRCRKTRSAEAAWLRRSEQVPAVGAFGFRRQGRGRRVLQITQGVKDVMVWRRPWEALIPCGHIIGKALGCGIGIVSSPEEKPLKDACGSEGSMGRNEEASRHHADAGGARAVLRRSWKDNVSPIGRRKAFPDGACAVSGCWVREVPQRCACRSQGY